MIIGKSGIPMLKVGYPTVSDKYNVVGAVLTGSDKVKFGQLVKYTTTTGYYEKATTNTDIAGIVVATNVKLAEYLEEAVYTNPGEAFNLLLNGYIAVELKDTDTDKVKPNGKVYVTSDAQFSADESSNTELTGYVFTGICEKHGDKVIAEILVK